LPESTTKHNQPKKQQLRKNVIKVKALISTCNFNSSAHCCSLQSFTVLSVKSNN